MLRKHVSVSKLVNEREESHLRNEEESPWESDKTKHHTEKLNTKKSIKTTFPINARIGCHRKVEGCFFVGYEEMSS